MISNFLKSLNNGTLLLSIYRNLNHRKYTVQESNNLIGLYMRLVCYEKVHDKYMYVLENHKPSKKIDQVKSNYLWVSWFQGYDNAPELPRKCIDNIRSRFSDYQVVLIDQDNFSEYIDIPDWFLEKWKKGVIDNTKLSNLIRLELLIKYGGIWMDSTVFCSDSKLPDYITNSDLFMYAENGLGDIRMGATWLISAKSNNNILRATRDVYLEYWKNENELIEYFLITFCIKMAAEKYPEEWKAMPKIPAINQYMLATDVFDVYDEVRWNQLKNLTSIHKLSFKESKELYAAFDDAMVHAGWYDQATTKNSRQIIKEHESFFDGLSDIHTVIVIGHSLSEVDMEYFEKICSEIHSDAKWIFSCHDSAGLKAISALVKTMAIGADRVTIFRL